MHGTRVSARWITLRGLLSVKNYARPTWTRRSNDGIRDGPGAVTLRDLVARKTFQINVKTAERTIRYFEVASHRGGLKRRKLGISQRATKGRSFPGPESESAHSVKGKLLPVRETFLHRSPYVHKHVDPDRYQTPSIDSLERAFAEVIRKDANVRLTTERSKFHALSLAAAIRRF